MSAEAILILGKGILWFGAPIVFCSVELWQLARDRSRDDDGN